LKGRGLLKEDDIREAMREIRLSLLEADVNFKVVKEFTENVTKRAIGKEVLNSITPGQQVVKIVYDELCALMGSSDSKIKLPPNPPGVVMLVGLHGSGKTTSAAKLALSFKKDGKHPLLVALDTARPAAIEQLKTLGERIDVPVYGTRRGDDPVKVCHEAMKEAVNTGADVVILDTAGRLHIDDQLMDELGEIKKKANPHEILLVADSMTGQDAVNIADAFNKKLGITGVILTKVDGDARGGAALSIVSVTGKPIKFIGTGEKIEPLEVFHPDRIASRILGFGDILTLVEKAQSAIEMEEALALEKKIAEDTFTFDDLKNQIRQIRRMGPLENLIKMIPGIGKQLKGIKINEKEFTKIEAIINSMTKEERRHYTIINGSRRKRIAAGSGCKVSDVNRLIKQYVAMRKMMKKLKKGKGMKNLDIGGFLTGL
ncbi:MAG: signal recognition particle protein, partial [Nitrospirae bacterium]